MNLLRCKTCLGTYGTLLADGMRYFHTCPPVLYVRVKRGGNWLDVQPPNLLPGDIVTVQRDGKKEEIDAAMIVPDEVLLNTRQGDRPGHRNENVIATGPHAGEPIAAALEKDDVVVVAAPAVVAVDPTPIGG